MAQEQAPPSGPDLTQGVALADSRDGKLVGHVGNEEVLLVRSGSELFAIGAHCTPLSRAARRRARGRRQRAVPLAPRLLRSAQRRGGARAGLEPGRLLEGRAARRPDLRQGKARATKTAGRTNDKRAPDELSLSAAARRALRRPRCCGGAASAAASSC